MNKLFFRLLMIGCIFISSCKGQKEKEKDTASEKEKTELEKKITTRDYSIDKSISYSSVFFDSLNLENFITTNQLNDSISRRMRSFYNARNFQFAWFTGNGLTEQGRSFWNFHEYYTTYSQDNSLDDKALKKRMNALVAEDSFKVSGTSKNMVNTELALTQHFIRYILNNYQSGEIKRKEMERFVPFKKQDVMQYADSLLTKKHKDNRYYSDVNESYKLLKVQLQKYYEIAKNNGWQNISFTGKKLTKGTSSPIVLQIKNRLSITGELAQADTIQVFDDNLEKAVKTFQTSRGYTPDGVVTASLVRDMNVPVVERLKQIIINMDRMRWLQNHDDGNRIVVNIPEFVLHVYEGKKEAFNMPVVVGKEGHNTTIFTGNLNQVVFSPYWNVTPSIIAKEILPALARDPSYLERNNMEETGKDEDGLPVIRQLPGPKNSLGKVKFLFPNSFDIYFHDTPAKELFNNSKRAYSHGCIRLSDPEKMANYLLRNSKEWDASKINEAMNSGVETFVALKPQVPVLITYYTAWVDENGLLNFRDDVYKHDKQLIERMFSR